MQKIKFSYEELLAFLDAVENNQIKLTDYTIPEKMISDIKSYKPKEIEYGMKLRLGVDAIRLYHNKYQNHYWYIEIKELQLFLRQYRINKFLDYAKN